MSGPEVELEERLRRLAPAFKDGIEPPLTMHASVMSRTRAPRGPVRGRAMLRELSLAAALIAFVALLAFGFSRLHSLTPGPIKHSPSVIPWTSATPIPLKLQVPKTRLSPDQVAEDVWQTVTDVHPVLLPHNLPAIPSGFEAQLYDDAASFSVRYTTSDGRVIMFSIVIPNPSPGTPNARHSQPRFRGVQSEYQVDDATIPTSSRWLMWTEPGTPMGGLPGVPYLLSTTGLTETEFWTVANSIDTVQAPVTAPACRLADLDVVPSASTGPSGRALYRISLSNHGRTACSLVGFADISLIASQGNVVTTPQSDDYGLAGTDIARLVLLPPNQPTPAPQTTVNGAYFVFEWYYCGATPPPILAIEIALPGSAATRRVALSPKGPQIQPRCDDPSQGRVLLASAIQGPNGNRGAVTPPSLRVAIGGLPDTLAAGATLRYTVTLTNDSRAPIAFEPCPDYEEGFAPDRLVSYQLNCAPLQRLDAGRSATFAMEFTVLPSSMTPVGQQTFLWRLHGFFAGASASKVVTVTAP